MGFSRSPGALIRIATAIGALALMAVLVNIYLFSRVQTLQATVNQRQQYISESAPLVQLNTALVQALAATAVNSNDAAIRDMLHEQGIDYTVTPNATPGAAPAAPAGGK